MGKWINGMEKEKRGKDTGNGEMENRVRWRRNKTSSPHVCLPSLSVHLFVYPFIHSLFSFIHLSLLLY
jgi:hypothetical protein